MLLLTGPPGSGKSHHILREVRQALQARRSDFRLLVPTTTMGEHLRNQMAREGFVFRPRLIGTLSKFIESYADLPQVSPASLDLVAAEALDRLAPDGFREVAALPGFRASLAKLIEEVSSAGCDSARLSAALAGRSRETELIRVFPSVLAEVERGLELRGAVLRGKYVEHAARKIQEAGLSGIKAVFLDGFFSLTEPELALIDALRRYADVTITLPSWHGAEAARAALVAMGLREQRCEKIRPTPRAAVVSTATMSQEIEEIARRILEEAAAGRPFREIGIVIRSRNPYVPALQTVLERFGIPARFHFASPLAEHPLVRYLSGAVDAMLGGWDHEQTLDVLRMTASGLGATSVIERFDFAVRERLPGQGIEGLRRIARDQRLHRLLDSFERLDSWRALACTASEWAQRLEKMTSWFRPSNPPDPPTHESAAIQRSYAAALPKFGVAIQEAADAFDPKKQVSFTDFWKQAKTVLRLTDLRVPDRRRNVVHVLDVYEARQWELPVVFVCGLLEKQFPLYHSQDPILPDEARRALQKTGLRLRTAAGRDQEERFLFDLAATRATSKLVLSYPQFNQKGEDNLPSFFLGGFAGRTAPSGPRVRPQSSRRRISERRPAVYDAELREQLGERHAAISPSAIETFLQCPFQFFGRHTLKLESPPADPFERLDPLVQGSVVHETLARWMRDGGELRPLFESVFRDACEKARVPAGYRTEAVRLELYRNLQRFAGDSSVSFAWKSETEQSFEVDLEKGLRVRGRIDRIDFTPDGKALVIDYKYSRKDRIIDRVKSHEKGTRVQGGLYMLAVERGLHCETAGMLFAGLRREVSWDGWHLPLVGLEKVGEQRDRESLRDLIDIAERQTFAAAREIREGSIAPNPADPHLCQFCEFRDICRVETVAAVATVGEISE